MVDRRRWTPIRVYWRRVKDSRSQQRDERLRREIREHRPVKDEFASSREGSGDLPKERSFHGVPSGHAQVETRRPSASFASSSPRARQNSETNLLPAASAHSHDRPQSLDRQHHTVEQGATVIVTAAERPPETVDEAPVAAGATLLTTDDATAHGRDLPHQLLRTVRSGPGVLERFHNAKYPPPRANVKLNGRTWSARQLLRQCARIVSCNKMCLEDSPKSSTFALSKKWCRKTAPRPNLSSLADNGHDSPDQVAVARSNSPDRGFGETETRQRHSIHEFRRLATEADQPHTLADQGDSLPWVPTGRDGNAEDDVEVMLQREVNELRPLIRTMYRLSVRRPWLDDEEQQGRGVVSGFAGSWE